MTFDLEFEGVATDPWGNTKAGFTAETEINRKDWGLDYNAALEAGGVLIGEKVKITLEIEALKAAEPEAASEHGRQRRPAGNRAAPVTGAGTGSRAPAGPPAPPAGR